MKNRYANGRSHMREGGKCRGIKEANMVDVHTIKNECTICKPVEITLRMGLRWKGKKTGDGKPIRDIIHTYVEISQ
jgi:hypothetical protein